MKKNPLVTVRFATVSERAALEYVLNNLGATLEEFVNMAVHQKIQDMLRKAEAMVLKQRAEEEARANSEQV